MVLNGMLWDLNRIPKNPRNPVINPSSSPMKITIQKAMAHGTMAPATLGISFNCSASCCTASIEAMSQLRAQISTLDSCPRSDG